MERSKRVKWYDRTSLALLGVGLAGLVVCGWCALHDQFLVCAVSGLAGTAAVRVAYGFARLALAAEGRRSRKS